MDSLRRPVEVSNLKIEGERKPLMGVIAFLLGRFITVDNIEESIVSIPGIGVRFVDARDVSEIPEP